MEENQKEYLSIKEFAILICVHQNTVRRAIKNGKISAFRIGSGKRASYRIARCEINRVALVDLEEIVKRMIRHEKGTQ